MTRRKIPARSALSLVVLLVSATALPGSLSGQSSTPRGDGYVTVRWCRSSVIGASTIRARLIPEPGVRSTHVYIQLHDRSSNATCQIPVDQGALALTMGGFEFLNVPSGSYELRVSGGGLRRVTPLVFDLASPATVDFDIQLQVENRVLDCFAYPRCANVLARRTSAETGAGEERGLAIIAHRLALALTIEFARTEEEWVACIDGPIEMVPLLREIFDPVAPKTECPTGLELYVPIFHQPSNRPARVVRVDRITRPSATTARIMTSYVSATSHGAGFECDLEYVNEFWVPRTCRHTVDF